MVLLDIKLDPLPGGGDVEGRIIRLVSFALRTLCTC